jgi:two-component system cell cycle sensor histidine kinase/response regulator CckA
MQCTSDLPLANDQSQQEAAIRRSVKGDLCGSEDRYRQMVEGAEDLIYSLTPDGHFTFVNAAAARAVSRSAEECLGMHFLSLIREDFRNQAIEFYEEQTKERIPLSYFELPMKCEDNQEIWVGQNVQLVIENGEIAALQAFGRDITQRKQIEQQLLESERRYRDIFTFAPVGIYQSLPDGTIIAANNSLAEMLGYESADELLTVRMDRDVYLGEQERERLIEEYETRGYARDLEIRWKKKDGSAIWVELTAHAIKGPDGSTEYFEGFVHDITGRKRMEDERQLISEIIQGVINTSDLNELLTLIHQSIRRYLYAENCFVALYDEATKLMQFPFWVDKLDPRPEPRPVGIGFSSYVLRTGKPMLVDPELTELMYQRGEVEKSGSKSASWMGVPLRTSERTIGVLVVQHYEEENAYDLRDLEFLTSVGNQIALAIERKRAETNLRETEDRLRQSQKMESIGSLAGGIAHDFNNLMTAVTGYSELALRSLKKDDPLRFKIEEIKKAGERAASLTRQLLAFSRKQMLQPRVLDLNQIISELDKMLRRLIGEDMMLETLLDPALGQVKADPGQIEQVLMNLVVNARDAMPTGGKLTIETRNAYIDQTYIKPQEILRPGHYVVLAVSDEGHGMDAQTQQKIFEPFFTTKDVGKGTGLGLATVYGVVKQSDGYIWVYSEPDKGTTFKIYLPRVDDAKELVETAERERVELGHETVLLVEDEQIVRNLAQEVLKQYGYTVICAADGEEGLRVCKEFEGRIALMITDVVMPRMSGRELAEQVATLRPDTRVLYMSGFTDDAIVRHGMLHESFAFIQKPFSPDSLALKARQVLDQSVH